METKFEIENNIFRLNHTENGKLLTQEEKTLSGKRKLYKDEEGNTFQYEYNAFDRLSSVKLPMGETHTIYRDSLGRIKEIKRSEIGSIHYKYSTGTELIQAK